MITAVSSGQSQSEVASRYRVSKGWVSSDTMGWTQPPAMLKPGSSMSGGC